MFLIVAARRVARCLLYSSYTAKFHSGMQTRSSASPSDVSSTRLNQTKSDLGVIIPHFGWQSNQKQVRPLEGANKKRFQTLRPSLEKSGGVLKLEPFFVRCRAPPWSVVACNREATSVEGNVSQFDGITSSNFRQLLGRLSLARFRAL